MSNIFVASYTNLALSRARDPLSVPISKKVCFALRVPPEGFLNRLTVYQVPAASGGGTSKNFEVELLTSALPFPVGQYGLTDSPVAPLEPFRVQIPPTGPLTATAGNVITLASAEIGMAYRNLDGTPSEELGELYLLIKPISAVDTTKWCVYLQLRQEART